MYWGDTIGLIGYIERANLDGTNRTVLRTEVKAMYIAFVLHNGNIYFTDWLSS